MHELVTTIFDICYQLGPLGLFLLAFLAASLVPIGSEWLLAVQLTEHADLGSQSFLVLCATAGNTLGGIANYLLARGGIALFRPKSTTKYQRLNNWVERHGAKAAFFAWLPWLGEPITIAAGILRLPFTAFVLYSALGRLLRYGVLWWMVAGV